MSRERIMVRLNQEDYFHTPGISKRIYSHEVTPGDEVEVLSTNDIDSRQVVRISSEVPLDKDAITFAVSGEQVAQVICEAFPQGIYEFVITTQEALDREAQEDEVYTERQKAMKKAAPLLRYQRAKNYFAVLEKNDPRVAEYYRQQEAQSELERQAEQTPLQDSELELAPQASTEDLHEVPVLLLERKTFPGQLKSDALKVVLRSPFGDSDTAQLRVATTFAYARKGSDQLLPDRSKETRTYAYGQIPAGGEISVESSIYFSPNVAFEMSITLEDIRTGRTVQRVISSDEFGAPQVVPKVKESVAGMAAD